MSNTKTITEIRRLGTCRVNFGGRDMGYTFGGCTAKITTDWVDINVDDFGTVPVDDIDTGTNIDVFVPLIQASVDNYEDAFNTGRREADPAGGEDRLVFGRKVGTSIVKMRLVLDPINDVDGIVLYKAGCYDVDELGYNNEGARILGLHFKAFMDEDRADGDRLFRIFGGLS